MRRGDETNFHGARHRVEPLEFRQVAVMTRGEATATEAEASFIRDLTFHDLRHDFAHRAKKEAGLDDGELAVYLGHITKRGTPAIQTTARYTQPSMDQIREKLKGMKGT